MTITAHTDWIDGDVTPGGPQGGPAGTRAHIGGSHGSGIGGNDGGSRGGKARRAPGRRTMVAAPPRPMAPPVSDLRRPALGAPAVVTVVALDERDAGTVAMAFAATPTMPGFNEPIAGGAAIGSLLLARTPSRLTEVLEAAAPGAETPRARATAAGAPGAAARPRPARPVGVRPAGVRWSETFTGWLAFGHTDFTQTTLPEHREPVTADLTVVIRDLDRYRAAQADGGIRDAEALPAAVTRGCVHCDALGGELTVRRGTFQAFVPATQAEPRDALHLRMRYEPQQHVPLAGPAPFQALL